MTLTQALIPYEITARTWKQNGFRDSYAWHQRIWEAFPNQPQAKRNFLTRLDDIATGFRLLILSPNPPTCPDWCPTDNWQSKAIQPDFYQHSHYHFSLLANPTVKRVVRDAQGQRKKNGRREALSSREDLLEWMGKKAANHGFQVELSQLKTIPRPRQQFLKQGIAGNHTATEFQGTLQVTDQEKFHQAATQGIGTAKAFGFGLLCLAPLT